MRAFCPRRKDGSVVANGLCMSAGPGKGGVVTRALSATEGESQQPKVLLPAVAQSVVTQPHLVHMVSHSLAFCCRAPVAVS